MARTPQGVGATEFTVDANDGLAVAVKGPPAVSFAAGLEGRARLDAEQYSRNDRLTRTAHHCGFSFGPGLMIVRLEVGAHIIEGDVVVGEVQFTSCVQSPCVAGAVHCVALVAEIGKGVCPAAPLIGLLIIYVILVDLT